VSREATGNGADTPYNAVADPAMPPNTPPLQLKCLIVSMLSYQSEFAYIAAANILIGVLARWRRRADPKGYAMNITRIACAAVLLLAGSAMAQDREGGKAIQQITISLGTATPGGGFPIYGNGFAEVINEADPTLLIEPRNTKGSNENIPLLEAGNLDIALVAGEPCYEAFAGIGRPPTTLKILTAIFSSPGMFVVRADSPYKTIRDLVGKPVAFGAKGSGLPILSRYILDGLGLKQDEDFQSIYLDRAGDGPAMVLDGRAAALWGAGIGWPGFAAMAASPGGARFIAPDPDEIARIRTKHSFLKPLTVPAGSYPNQTAPINARGALS
jgi:hypothetical protein